MLFAGQGVVGIGQEGGADFVQRHIGHALPGIMAARLQQGGQQGSAHKALLLAERISKSQLVAFGAVLGPAKSVQSVGLHHGEAEVFVKPTGAEKLAYPPPQPLGAGEAAAGGKMTRESQGDVVIAVNNGDFFNKVHFALHFSPEGGHGYQ